MDVLTGFTVVHVKGDVMTVSQMLPASQASSSSSMSLSSTESVSCSYSSKCMPSLTSNVFFECLCHNCFRYALSISTILMESSGRRICFYADSKKYPLESAFVYNFWLQDLTQRYMGRTDKRLEASINLHINQYLVHQYRCVNSSGSAVAERL